MDPKVVQLASLAAQRFSEISPRAMFCQQHGGRLQIVGPPRITSACSQARCIACLPACALHQPLTFRPGVSEHFKAHVH